MVRTGVPTHGPPILFKLLMLGFLFAKIDSLATS